MNKRTNTQRGLAVLLSLLMLIGCLAGCAKSSSSGSAGSKSVTFTVVHGDGSSKEFSLQTEAESLRAALEEEKLIEGEESDYGLFVKTVDGETADDSNQEWWCLTKDGEMWNYGVDDTEIADGDKFEFTLTVGY